MSTLDQVKNHSLPTQLKACRDYCLREGLEVAVEFMEEGESAKTADRTKLQEMLGYITDRKNRISTVVVYSINRFARNAGDHYALRGILASKGITLRSVTEGFDDTAEGKVMEGILAIVAQFDNDKRSDRTKAGMESVVASGGYPFRCPIGYLPAEKPLGGGRTLPILKPDPERAPWIRRAFELVADGVSKAEALRTVTALGLRTLHGKNLTPQTFNELLKKAIYCGRIEVWNFDVRAAFETIVSEELFDKCRLCCE